VTAVLLVDDATRRRRAHRLALALVHGSAVRCMPRRSRRRTDVCTAAGLLTAIGARIEVRAPSAPWPRPNHGRLVVADRIGRLDDLALLTVVPDRVAGVHEADGHDGPVCPVAVRYRTEDGGDPTGLLAGDDLRTTIRRALAVRGLVIEVHLLPSRDGALPTVGAAAPAQRSSA
jgi:hypothetical protein